MKTVWPKGILMEENQWQTNKKNPDIAQSLDRVTRQFPSTRSQTFKLT